MVARGVCARTRVYVWFLADGEQLDAGQENAWKVRIVEEKLQLESPPSHNEEMKLIPHFPFPYPTPLFNPIFLFLFMPLPNFW